jgi:predicted AlkP superfamily phosphohydrolase/phosphomutase
VNVDWSRTRAYGLGMNGLYINLQGREKWGIVHPEDKDALMEEITRKLQQTIDPQTGEAPIAGVYRPDEVFEHKEQLAIGPDMIVGYNKGYRCSNESTLGGIPPEAITDNTDWWSGDHCIDREVVPGILLTSRPLKKAAPRLENLAAAVVAEFGIEDFPSEHSAQTASTKP